jgi:hypothetical protein
MTTDVPTAVARLSQTTLLPPRRGEVASPIVNAGGQGRPTSGGVVQLYNAALANAPVSVVLLRAASAGPPA